MKFNVKKRKASHKDFSFHRSVKLGAIGLPSSYWIPSQILQQDDEDCTAFSSVGARMSEIPQSVLDPDAFWQDELDFADVTSSQGFDIEVPAATAVEKGFVPTGNTAHGYKPSAYLWITPNNGMDLFDSVRQAIFASKYPAMGGLVWYNEWMGMDTITQPGTNPIGGHCIRIAGWRTNLANGNLEMGLPNTWGIEVGDQGIFWMSRDVFNQSFSPFGVFIWTDSNDFTIKTLGLINALWVNIKTLLNR